MTGQPVSFETEFDLGRGPMEQWVHLQSARRYFERPDGFPISTVMSFPA